MTAPKRKPGLVDQKATIVRDGVKCSDVLEEATAARTSVIRHNDAIKGPLLGPGTGKTNVNGHRVFGLSFSGPERYWPHMPSSRALGTRVRTTPQPFTLMTLPSLRTRGR